MTTAVPVEMSSQPGVNGTTALALRRCLLVVWPTGTVGYGERQMQLGRERAATRIQTDTDLLR